MREGYPRKSFVFYRSFYDALDGIEANDRWTIIDAIIMYGLHGVEPELDGLMRIVFTLIKPQIDANHDKFINGQKGAEHGSKGGRPASNNPTETPSEPQANPTETRNVNVNANVNENVNVKKGNFTPPSLDEFKNYFKENDYSAELAERAFKGYDVAGWTDAKGKPINNWKQKAQHVWFKDENKRSVTTCTENKPYPQLRK